ncbi:MAG TPA: YceH family protein [Desulfuromonadales bacterium]|nr:YceH family protein [Desulfuromonadales bacterium]
MELPALNSVEIRVLGCLVEKEMATPDYYPLTLKALTAACNQKSNRNPVMELSETDVLQGIDLLRHKGLALVAAGGGRVPRYGHNLEARLHLEPPALAVLCELMIRGPQTIGELRTRAERLHPFDSLQDVETVVRELGENEPPLVAELPRQPGSRENRYKHLLGTGKEDEETETVETSAAGSEHKIHVLEKELDDLRDEVEALRRELAEFKSQFE